MSKKRSYHDIDQGESVTERVVKKFKGRATDVIHAHVDLPQHARLIICPATGPRLTHAVMWTPRRCVPALCQRINAALAAPAATRSAEGEAILQFLCLGPSGVADWSCLPPDFQRLSRAELGLEQLAYKVTTIVPYPFGDAGQVASSAESLEGDEEEDRSNASQ